MRFAASFGSWGLGAIRLLLIGSFVGSMQWSDLPKVSAQDAKSGDGTVKILFAGDIMLDGGPGNFVANGKDPFEGCASLFEGVDLCIGNLECVVGRGGQMRIKPYVFRGANDSPRFIKKYFHAVSLANNHTMQYPKNHL